MKSVHIFISGVVQGVGFRAWLYRKANMLDVSGWCKNNADGSVEALVSGEVTKVDALLKAVEVGPPHAKVDAIQISEMGGGIATGPFRIIN